MFQLLENLQVGTWKPMKALSMLTMEKSFVVHICVAVAKFLNQLCYDFKKLQKYREIEFLKYILWDTFNLT